MDVIQIVKEYLISKKYDGLYCHDCSCDIEDLFPCTDYSGECRPGIKVPCPDDCGDHDFHIKVRVE